VKKRTQTAIEKAAKALISVIETPLSPQSIVLRFYLRRYRSLAAQFSSENANSNSYHTLLEKICQEEDQAWSEIENVIITTVTDVASALYGNDTAEAITKTIAAASDTIAIVDARKIDAKKILDEA
jgi:hypothetical protein